ncbi:MAG: helix-turn-helix domain-containing protein [Anaerolineae bacterium]
MKREDRRVDRTRALLQQALMELIREKGYDAVTIQDITDRANVGRATFYLHYPSKDALFLSSHLKGHGLPYYGVLAKRNCWIEIRREAWWKSSVLSKETAC